MERLKLCSHVKVKASGDVKHSRIGIGFEKLDRNVFDPEKAYDKVAALGVKWVRLQTGWARCEKEKGVYDFKWLDDIVNNFISRSMIPWFNLTYGNEIYTKRAKTTFGSVGCPPINSEEEMNAWLNYVRALVKHFKGRVDYYEIWNEPDLKFSWKHNCGIDGEEPGPNAIEYADFCAATADAIHSVNKDANAMGFALGHPQDIEYLNEAFAHGILSHIDSITFHSYSSDDKVRPGRIQSLYDLCAAYGSNIDIIQGETGCQSRSDGAGALRGFAWTPQRQLKHLLRNMIIDLSTDVVFTSYFSTLDMIEALHGVVGEKSSYLDYGYFGVLAADFDEDGFSTGEYTPKPSYYALQTLASIFSEDFERAELPITRKCYPSKRVNGYDCNDSSIMTYGFKKPNGSYALAYWNAVPLLTSTYEGTVSFFVCALDDSNIKLIELANGNVYEIPESMKKKVPGGGVVLTNIPITDTPMLITFGNFADIE